MKPACTQPDKPRPRRKAAFTLVEMMVGTGIFLGIFIGVMVGLQIFGLRVYTLAATKLSATADARQALNALRNQIRSAMLVYVGAYSTTGGFSRIANGLPQTGNALELYFGTNDMTLNTISVLSTNPVIYYQNSSSATNALFSVSNNVVSLLANYVTNYDVFTTEDYQTNVLTVYDNNPVIRVTLQFYQWEYPLGVVGTNGVNAYNFYRLQTRISPRCKMPYAP
jgi:type II secretory pathway pseudopilin PulG